MTKSYKNVFKNKKNTFKDLFQRENQRILDAEQMSPCTHPVRRSVNLIASVNAVHLTSQSGDMRVSLSRFSSSVALNQMKTAAWQTSAWRNLFLRFNKNLLYPTHQSEIQIVFVDRRTNNFLEFKRSIHNSVRGRRIIDFQRKLYIFFSRNQ